MDVRISPGTHASEEAGKRCCHKVQFIKLTEKGVHFSTGAPNLGCYWSSLGPNTDMDEPYRFSRKRINPVITEINAQESKVKKDNPVLKIFSYISGAIYSRWYFFAEK